LIYKWGLYGLCQAEMLNFNFKSIFITYHNPASLFFTIISKKDVAHPTNN
jgi:hypothetical protein